MSALLSKRSLYKRFFAGTPALPSMYLAALAKVDHHDREALLALSEKPDEPEEVVVGIAEYIRDRAMPARADLAVLVADDWQRRGIGRRLVTELARLAARRGIAEFGADTLVTNRPALAAVNSAWPDARPERDGNTAAFRLPVYALLAGTPGIPVKPQARKGGEFHPGLHAQLRPGCAAGTRAGMA